MLEVLFLLVGMALPSAIVQGTFEQWRTSELKGFEDMGGMEVNEMLSVGFPEGTAAQI